MRDTLDLKALVQQGDQFRSTARRRNLRALVGIGLLVVILFALRVDTSPYGGVYRLENGAWRIIPFPMQGVPDTIRISDTNDIWMSTNVFPNLYHYQNSTWKSYSNSEVGSSSYPLNIFDVFGIEAWAAAGDSVVHWDGSKWSGYIVFEKAPPGSVVVGPYGVMMMDRVGTLTTHDQNGWRAGTAKMLLPGFIGGSDAPPQFEKTAFGNVLLNYFGLWRFDGSRWSAIRDFGPSRTHNYSILGVLGDTLLVQTSNSISAIDTNTDTAKAFTLAEVGISPTGLYLNRASSDGTHLYLPSNSGLRVFDGQTWKSSTLPPPVPNTIIGSVAFDAQGGVWTTQFSPTIFTPDFGAGFSLRYQIANQFGALILALAVVFVWVFPRSRAATLRAQQARPILYETMTDLQRYTPIVSNVDKFFRRWRFAYVVVLGLIFAAGILINSTVLGGVAAVFLLTLWNIGPSLLKLRDPSLDDATREQIARYIPINAALYMYLALLILIMFFITSDLFPQLISDRFIASLTAFIISYFVAFLVFYFSLTGPIYAIYRGPLARGDYDRALRHIDGWQHRIPNYLSFTVARANILLFTTLDLECEAVWRKVLTETQNSGPGFASISLTNIGTMLLRQNKSDAALPLLEGAVRLLPDYAFPYRTLAHYYQEIGEAPERALELSDAMVRFARKPRLALPLLATEWASNLATYALTLATAGQTAKANEYMGRAFSETDRWFRPGVANLHVSAGQIAMLANDLGTARTHYETALTLDPEGHAGREARDLLNKLNTATK